MLYPLLGALSPIVVIKEKHTIEIFGYIISTQAWFCLGVSHNISLTTKTPGSTTPEFNNDSHFYFKFFLMNKYGPKNSLYFLKKAFIEGPAQRRIWAVEELRKRWTEVDKDWQSKLDIFDSPYPTKNHQPATTPH